MNKGKAFNSKLYKFFNANVRNRRTIEVNSKMTLVAVGTNGPVTIQSIWAADLSMSDK